VVGSEEPVEAEALGRLRGRDQLLPGEPLLRLDEDAELHGSILARRAERS